MVRRKLVSKEKNIDNIKKTLYNKQCHIYGEVAQLARAFGSYPTGRWFKSTLRYQND